MFTKQHMIAVARIVNESGAKGAVRSNLVRDFGEMFANDNPKFSWERWREACEKGLIRERPNAKPRPIDTFVSNPHGSPDVGGRS